jgi:hypothetical protein
MTVFVYTFYGTNFGSKFNKLNWRQFTGWYRCQVGEMLSYVKIRSSTNGKCLVVIQYTQLTQHDTSSYMHTNTACIHIMSESSWLNLAFLLLGNDIYPFCAPLTFWCHLHFFPTLMWKWQLCIVFVALTLKPLIDFIDISIMEFGIFQYEKRRRMVLRHQNQTKCLLAVTLRLLTQFSMPF